ncbi:MAG: hypothetical protein M1426_05730 [Patescibacteria group bacterium]|nr:hypothetical protein [Patescibacteria group bacterium]
MKLLNIILNKVVILIIVPCFIIIFYSPFLFAQSLFPRLSNETIILENDYLLYEIRTDGFNKSFIDKKSGKDYLDIEYKSKFMSINLGNGFISASKIEYANNYLFVTFGLSDICARIHVRIFNDYITFELISINNQSVHEFQLTNLPLTCIKFMSYFLSSTRDDDFTGCLIPLNIETTSKVTKNTFEEASLSNVIPVDIAKVSAQKERGSNSLIASCDSRVKLEGGKVAIIGCPTEKILDVIEQVEIEQGLPHPTINGVWARKAKENRQSYLFIDYSKSTVDEVIDYAVQGGFGYIMVYDGTWSSSHGSYTINRTNFPDGEDDLKKAVEKIHTAGLKAGIHTLDRVISKSDPLIHPIPHPGLLKRNENERIMEKDIEYFETFYSNDNIPQRTS